LRWQQDFDGPDAQDRCPQRPRTDDHVNAQTLRLLACGTSRVLKKGWPNLRIVIP
jgi:hypothetical protein